MLEISLTACKTIKLVKIFPVEMHIVYLLQAYLVYC